MRAVIQLLVGLIVLLGGSILLFFLVPGTVDLARQVGVPDSVLSLVVATEKPANADKPKDQASGRRPNANGPPVVVTNPAGEGKTNDRLAAIGDGDAINSVTITPLVSGQLAEVRVKPGMRVKKGDIIAVLDDGAEKIALDTAKVALTAAENKLARNEDIKKIISRAELQDAQSAVDTARLALAQAEFNLKRRTITSPLEGVAGIFAFSTGDYVTVSSALVTIDDRSRLLVDFWVPERYSALLKEGMDVAAIAIARPGKDYPGKISAIDNRIDAASRTLHVQAEIPNDGDDLRAGQSFEVTLNLAGDVWPSVNPLSIQWDSGGSFVWRVKDNKVERVGVVIIERNPESVLVKGDIKKGDPIVVEGLQRLRPGAEVRLFGQDRKKNDTKDKAADPKVEAKAATQ